MKTVRRGVFTSELWLLIAAVGVGESQAITSNPKLNIAGMVAAAVYALARAYTKAGGGSGA